MNSVLNRDVVSVFAGDKGDVVVAFVKSEEEAKELIMAPWDTIIGTASDEYGRHFPDSWRTCLPIIRRELDRIQVDYVDEKPFRVRQMSVSEWRRELGLLPSRHQKKLLHTDKVGDLATVMMANGVR